MNQKWQKCTLCRRY